MKHMITIIANDEAKEALKPPLPSKGNMPRKNKMKGGTSNFKAISRETVSKLTQDPHSSKIAVIGHYRPRHILTENRVKSARFKPSSSLNQEKVRAIRENNFD
jgi:hypothetical protein